MRALRSRCGSGPRSPAGPSRAANHVETMDWKAATAFDPKSAKIPRELNNRPAAEVEGYSRRLDFACLKLCDLALKLCLAR